MKRGRANPLAYSSTEKPAGTLIGAPAGRGTTVGAFEIGGDCASIKAATHVKTKNDFMEVLFYTLERFTRWSAAAVSALVSSRSAPRAVSTPSATRLPVHPRLPL